MVHDRERFWYIIHYNAHKIYANVMMQIGIHYTKHKNTDDWEPLDTPIRDVRKMHNLLLKRNIYKTSTVYCQFTMFFRWLHGNSSPR